MQRNTFDVAIISTEIILFPIYVFFLETIGLPNQKCNLIEMYTFHNDRQCNLLDIQCKHNRCFDIKSNCSHWWLRFVVQTLSPSIDKLVKSYFRHWVMGMHIVCNRVVFPVWHFHRSQLHTIHIYWNKCKMFKWKKKINSNFLSLPFSRGIMCTFTAFIRRQITWFSMSIARAWQTNSQLIGCSVFIGSNISKITSFTWQSNVPLRTRTLFHQIRSHFIFGSFAKFQRSPNQNAFRLIRVEWSS